MSGPLQRDEPNSGLAARPIRVLVAEDSVTSRELLVSILSSDEAIAVVGQAKDGLEAVEMTRRLRPSVVTMDVRMPQMDGLAATKRIMVETPTPIVIVSGSVDAHEVETSLAALRAGALTVLQKPPGPRSPGFEEASRKLLDTVKAMSQVKVVRHWAERHPAKEVPAAGRAGAVARVVAIAASTGGPAALHRILSELPGDFPVPILVVQHIARGFVGGLADWLDGISPLTVKVAEDGELLRPRTVYLAPDERHLGVDNGGTAVLSSAPSIDGFRPSGTYLFESVAQAFGTSAVAVVLTGMGQDGVEGLRAVRAAGGRVIAQDKGSSVVFGMPAAAAASGCVDVVVSLAGLAQRLEELTARNGGMR